MTRKEITGVLSRRTGCTTKQAHETVDNVFNILAEALVKGENIYVRGFGTFKMIKRAEKKGQNIRTGETIIIPARRDVKFIPGKELKAGCLNFKKK